MQRWSGDLAKYRGLKGGRGEILHVVKKSAKVGPCEGGSESAMPACLAKQIVLDSVYATVHVVNYPWCVCEKTCVWVCMAELQTRLHENVTVDEKHVNNKWYCVPGSERETQLQREIKRKENMRRKKKKQAWKRKLKNDKEWWWARERKRRERNFM